MIIDIYDKRIDIGSRDEIDSIALEDSGYISKLSITHRNGDTSSHEIERKYYLTKSRWKSEGIMLQKFLKRGECKALSIDSHFDFDKS